MEFCHRLRLVIHPGLGNLPPGIISDGYCPGGEVAYA